MKTTKKEKAYLFVDGTNLYAAQYELFGPKEYLNFSEFIEKVQRALSVHFDRIYFYASFSPHSKQPTKKELVYLRNEGLFYRSVRTTPQVIFYTGHRSPTSGKEKGIDIHLGIDIAVKALLKEYSSVYILTGDSDLLYVVETVQKFKVPVHALFVPNRISVDIAFKADSATVVNLKGFFSRKSFKSLPRSLKIVPY